jgi:hypothetical protein
MAYLIAYLMAYLMAYLRRWPARRKVDRCGQHCRFCRFLMCDRHHPPLKSRIQAQCRDVAPCRFVFWVARNGKKRQETARAAAQTPRSGNVRAGCDRLHAPKRGVAMRWDRMRWDAMGCDEAGLCSAICDCAGACGSGWHSVHGTHLPQRAWCVKVLRSGLPGMARGGVDAGRAALVRSLDGIRSCHWRGREGAG